MLSPQTHVIGESCKSLSGSMRFICPECGGRIRSHSFIEDFGDAMSCTCQRGRRSLKNLRTKVCLFASLQNGEWGQVIIEDICAGGVGISTCRSNSILFVGDEILISIFCSGIEITVPAIVRYVGSGNERAGLQFLHLDEHPDVQLCIQAIVDMGEMLPT